MKSPYKFGDVVVVSKNIDGRTSNYLIIVDDIRINEKGTMDIDAIVCWKFSEIWNVNILQGYTTIRDVNELVQARDNLIKSFKEMLHYGGDRARLIGHYFLSKYDLQQNEEMPYIDPVKHGFIKINSKENSEINNQ